MPENASEDVDFFGTYIHNLYFRTLEDVERALPGLREALGDGFVDLPSTQDKGQWLVEIVSDIQLDEEQITAIQQIEGILSCDCNEDMQEIGVGFPRSQSEVHRKKE